MITMSITRFNKYRYSTSSSIGLKSGYISRLWGEITPKRRVVAVQVGVRGDGWADDVPLFCADELFCFSARWK